jgi:hypothetical protein
MPCPAVTSGDLDAPSEIQLPPFVAAMRKPLRR